MLNTNFQWHISNTIYRYANRVRVCRGQEGGRKGKESGQRGREMGERGGGAERRGIREESGGREKGEGEGRKVGGRREWSWGERRKTPHSTEAPYEIWFWLPQLMCLRCVGDVRQRRHIYTYMHDSGELKRWVENRSSIFKMCRLMTKPTKWQNVRPVKTQISLGIPQIWYESSLCVNG